MKKGNVDCVDLGYGAGYYTADPVCALAFHMRELTEFTGKCLESGVIKAATLQLIKRNNWQGNQVTCTSSIAERNRGLEENCLTAKHCCNSKAVG
jgi:hypothetical protein